MDGTKEFAIKSSIGAENHGANPSPPSHGTIPRKTHLQQNTNPCLSLPFLYSGTHTPLFPQAPASSRNVRNVPARPHTFPQPHFTSIRVKNPSFRVHFCTLFQSTIVTLNSTILLTSTKPVL